MFVVKIVKKDGTVVTYDAGDKTHWTDKQTHNNLGMSNSYNYVGSKNGTTSGYFTEGSAAYNKDVVIISVEDISFEDVKELSNLEKEIKEEEKQIEIGEKQIEEEGEIIRKCMNKDQEQVGTQEWKQELVI